LETKHKDNIISILLPTRGRTDALKTSLDSLFDLADDVGKLELLLGMDDDDAASSQWVQENLLPDLDARGIDYTLLHFEPLGYARLNVYVNALARHSSGDWFFFWNDDAVMLTQGWDTRVREKTSEFCGIRIPTHNCHPYAIFPIIPRAWLDICGYLSDHQLNDAWISQISYILDIMINVDIDVRHDRFDLTGANQDDTYQRRVMFEFDPSDPRDFNYPSRRQQRMQDAVKISNFLTAQGRNMTWFGRVLKGQQDPWAKMTGPEYDPNKQIKQWK
jgi:hypothetical protein